MILCQCCIDNARPNCYIIYWPVVREIENMSMSIAGQLVILFVAAAVVPALLIGAIAYNNGVESLRYKVEARLDAVNENQHRRLKNFFNKQADCRHGSVVPAQTSFIN